MSFCVGVEERGRGVDNKGGMVVVVVMMEEVVRKGREWEKMRK